MKYYDLIISLGEVCFTSVTLRKLGLQQYSYPFDWSKGVLWDKCGEMGFIGKVNMIVNNFADAFNLVDLEEFSGDFEHEFKFVRNKKTGLQYIHDFPKDKSLEEEFPYWNTKYQRRVKRLYEKISQSSQVLFVFIALSGVLNEKEIKEAQVKLQKKFKNTSIEILILQNSENSNNVTVKRLTNQITEYYFHNTSDIPPYFANEELCEKIISEYAKIKTVDINGNKKGA